MTENLVARLYAGSPLEWEAAHAIERLEREMAELEKHDSQCIKDRMVFIDEIERLRMALERIATASPKDGVYDGYQDIAREALQGAGTEGETKG